MSAFTLLDDCLQLYRRMHGVWNDPKLAVQPNEPARTNRYLRTHVSVAALYHLLTYSQPNDNGKLPTESNTATTNPASSAGLAASPSILHTEVVLLGPITVDAPRSTPGFDFQQTSMTPRVRSSDPGYNFLRHQQCRGRSLAASIDGSPALICASNLEVQLCSIQGDLDQEAADEPALVVAEHSSTFLNRRASMPASVLETPRHGSIFPGQRTSAPGFMPVHLDGDFLQGLSPYPQGLPKGLRQPDHGCAVSRGSTSCHTPRAASIGLGRVSNASQPHSLERHSNPHVEMAQPMQVMAGRAGPVSESFDPPSAAAERRTKHATKGLVEDRDDKDFFAPGTGPGMMDVALAKLQLFQVRN